MTEKRFIVTGASGFIGGLLCQALLAEGGYVAATAQAGEQGPWDESISWRVGDGEQRPFPKADAVFHLAGKAHAYSESYQDEGEYFRINTEGTRQALEAARAVGIRRFVLFSSVKAMGEGGEASLDESASCHPETPYGESKLAAEKLVLEGGYVPEPVVLRLSMVYGNTQKGNLPRMIRAVEKGQFLPLPEVGNRRSMVHVEDVVQAAMLAAEKPEAIGQIYIVTDGTPYSTHQIHAWICEALGKQVPAWSVPMPILHALAMVGDGIGFLRRRRFMFDSDALDKLVGPAWYSSRKIEDELEFSPRHHLHESLPGIIRYLHGLNA